MSDASWFDESLPSFPSPVLQPPPSDSTNHITIESRLLLGDYDLMNTAQLDSELENTFMEEILLHNQLNLDNIDKEIDVLMIGIRAINLFMQINYTGPEINLQVLWNKQKLNKLEKLDEKAISLLKNNDENISKCKYPGLLLFAKCILVDAACKFKSLVSAWVWCGRVCRVHQNMLSNPVPELSKLSEIAYATGLRNIELHCMEQKSLLYSRVCVEYALNEMTYWRYQVAENLLEKAKSSTRLTADLCGAKGRRTRFQTEDKTILYLSASSDSSTLSREDENFPPLLFSMQDNLDMITEYSILTQTRKENIRKMRRERMLKAKRDSLHSSKGEKIEAEIKEPDTDDEMDIEYPQWRDSPAFDENFPSTAPMDDEASLETASFSTSIEFERLAPVDTCILIAHLELLIATSPSNDMILNAALLARCERILRFPNRYISHFYALIKRSLLERGNKKSVFRAMTQLEATKAEHPAATTRLRDIFCCNFQDKFNVEGTLAFLHLANNFRKSALDIYTKLEKWDKVVELLVSIGLRDDADLLLRKMISEKCDSDSQLPYLWCLLGEVWNKEEFFLKSWEISAHGYSRAMRGLGDIERNRDCFDKAIECYNLALGINPLFPNTWFKLGWCCLQVHKYSEAIVAFSRVVNHEPDNGEAWNNLASAHLSCKNYSMGLYALEQAVKILQDNWKVWDNIVTASVELKKWNKVCFALDRIVGLQSTPETAIDTSTVALCMCAVVAQCSDQINDSVSHQLNFFDTLMNKLCNRFTANPGLWQIYSEYCLHLHQIDRAVQFRMNACRCYSKDIKWDVNELSFRQMVIALESCVTFFIEHTPSSYDNFNFAKLELERARIKANKSDFLLTKQLEGGKVEESFQAINSTLSLVQAHLNRLQPAPASSLIDSMSMWR